MSATRTAPRWTPWTIRRGDNLAQAFRWVDDGGPVNLTGRELYLRIRLADGTLIEKQAGVDPEFIIFDQADPLSTGIFSYQPSVELTLSLPSEPAAEYWFEARYDGFRQIIGEGAILMRPAEVANG